MPSVDYFFGQVEPVAARVPYIVCIGNHEYDYLGQPFAQLGDYGTDSGGSAVHCLFFLHRLCCGVVFSFITRYQIILKYCCLWNDRCAVYASLPHAGG